MVWLNSLGLDLNSSIYKLCVLEKVIQSLCVSVASSIGWR